MLKTTTTKPYWCALPNTSNAKLDGASYDTEEEATAAAEKRTEPLIAIMGTRTIMGGGGVIPHFVKSVTH